MNTLKPSIRVQNVVFVWGLVFIGMVIYVICWFSLGLPLIYFLNAVKPMVYGQLDSFGRSVVDVTFFAFEVHPAIALLGWFIYGIMHSAKKDTDIYEQG